MYQLSVNKFINLIEYIVYGIETCNVIMLKNIIPDDTLKLRQHGSWSAINCIQKQRDFR